MAFQSKHELQRRIEGIAFRAALRSDDTTRHKCFVSYHHEDQAEVETFIQSYGEVFIAKALGVSDEDDFINSDDTDYVMRRIREEYLTDSTVTIVLVGKCTWARRYVDWEIMSSLRNDSKNRRSGLLGITLPSAAQYAGKKPPERLSANLSGANGDEGYARWKKYPTAKSSLRSWIDDAFSARDDRGHLVRNAGPRFKSNRTCP
jgi:hypothetical protein